MIWETYQQTKIASAEHAADRAENKASRTADDLYQLRRHVDRLTLACQAMWELLRDNSALTEEELEAKILEVDLRDGSADGKIGTQIGVCQNCGRNTNSRRQICVMCGAPIKRDHIFEG